MSREHGVVWHCASQSDSRKGGLCIKTGVRHQGEAGGSYLLSSGFLQGTHLARQDKKM